MDLSARRGDSRIGARRRSGLSGLGSGGEGQSRVWLKGDFWEAWTWRGRMSQRILFGVY